MASGGTACECDGRPMTVSNSGSMSSSKVRWNRLAQQAGCGGGVAVGMRVVKLSGTVTDEDTHRNWLVADAAGRHPSVGQTCVAFHARERNAQY